jgi:excisionase family DNA binding protein
MDEMIAIDDAAAELNVSRATIWNWIRRYELPTFRRPGERRTLLRRADVARLREPIPVDRTKKAVA